MSSIGARRSDRIAGLIYLDAAWDRTYVLPHKALGAGVEKPDYARIRVAALALYPAPGTWSEMMPGAPMLTSPQQQAAAERVVALAARTRKYMADTFRSGVKNSRVIEIPGASHYIFRTNEAEVLREIRTFIKTLP